MDSFLSDILEVLKSSKIIRISIRKTIKKRWFEALGKGGLESLKCHLPEEAAGGDAFGRCWPYFYEVSYHSIALSTLCKEGIFSCKQVFLDLGIHMLSKASSCVDLEGKNVNFLISTESPDIAQI